jgi:hypothetical protein
MWSAAAGSPISLDGLLFGNDGHNLSRVNPDTGDVLWTYSTPTSIYGLGAVHEGVVFAGIAGTSPGTDSFVGIDVDTGAVAWQSDQAFFIHEPRDPIPFRAQFAFDGPITIVQTAGPLAGIQTGK